MAVIGLINFPAVTFRTTFQGKESRMATDESKSISRRQLIRNGMALGGSAAALMMSGSAIAEMCNLTVPQGEGPYYPQGDLERDADLVQIKPGDPVAKGQIVFVSGVVSDPECKPVEGALVEIWQACYSGKYNHSEDPHSLFLDPSFQYWGRTHTRADGTFLFRTVIPGHYPNGGNTFRPPHIHFKAHAQGFLSLTTQQYFDERSYDDPELAKVVKKWNDYEQVPESLKVFFKPSPRQPGAKEGTFDITLRPN